MKDRKSKNVLKTFLHHWKTVPLSRIIKKKKNADLSKRVLNTLSHYFFRKVED